MTKLEKVFFAFAVIFLGLATAEIGRIKILQKNKTILEERNFYKTEYFREVVKGEMKDVCN